jgi:hypothetical protein
METDFSADFAGLSGRFCTFTDFLLKSYQNIHILSIDIGTDSAYNDI